MPISKITGSAIADDSITSARLDDGTIVAVDLASDAVTTAKIADDAVTTAKINAGAVDTTELADDAVTTAKILDGNITVGKLASSGTLPALDGSNLTGVDPADGSITTAKIADDAVTTAKIPDDAITTAKITDDAVTEAKWGGNQLSHRNLIINGAMQIAQRGTSGTNTGDSQFPSVDRWLTRTYNGNGRVTLARQSISETGFRYSLRVTPSTTDTSGTYGYGLGQYIEGYNTNHLNWGTDEAQTITLSFWVKSSETGTFSVSFRNGAGNRSWVSSYSISTADTFEYKTITVTGPTDGGWELTTGASILLEFCYGGQTSKETSSLDQWVTGNYTAATGQTDIMGSTSNYFEITGVQLEAGSVATPFEHRSYGEELARCQRYFYTTFDNGTTAGTATYNGCYEWISINTYTYHNQYIQWSAMRDSPSITIYSPHNGTQGKMSADATDHDMSAARIFNNGAMFYVANSSISSGANLRIHYTLDSELS